MNKQGAKPKPKPKPKPKGNKSTMATATDPIVISDDENAGDAAKAPAQSTKAKKGLKPQSDFARGIENAFTQKRAVYVPELSLSVFSLLYLLTYSAASCALTRTREQQRSLQEL